jgi:hypothetical protein
LEPTVPTNRKTLLIAGAALLALAAVMMVVAGCLFTLAQTPSPFVGAIARVTFWGFIPTGILGAIVLVAGLMSGRAAGGTK